MSLALYSTYAMFTASSTINNVVSINATLTTTSNIMEYEIVTVATGESKIIEVTIKNSYSATLYYGAWYEIVSGSSSDIDLGLYTSKDSTASSGTISSGSSITLLVGIKNTGSSKAIVNIGTVGSLSSSLGIASPRALLPTGWNPVKTFADTIIDLSQGSTWSSGASGVYYTNSHEYRYIGANVNNFVSFNNDLYRIIGVFDEYSHGVSGANLVKLISANVITANSWGVYNSSATSGTYSDYANDWRGETTGVKANLNILLNEYFYNKASTSSTYGACTNWTYYYNGTNYRYRTNDCAMIEGYGINSTYQNYIENATWYLYGYSGNGLSKQNWYLCERGDNSSCTTGNSGTYSPSTTAKIGLMYVSDYMYASGYFSNSDTTTGSSYYCGNQNWLYQGNEWTITPRSSSATYAFIVNYIGYVYYNVSYISGVVRPTFYLKSTVYVTGGTGTMSDPYTISM